MVMCDCWNWVRTSLSVWELNKCDRVQQTHSSLEGKRPSCLEDNGNHEAWTWTCTRGQAGAFLVDLELLDAAVRFKWLVFLCFQQHFTGMTSELGKHPDTNVADFLALLSIFPSMLWCIWPN